MLTQAVNKKFMLLTNSDFDIFLSKFNNILISKGKKSKAINNFDKILINLKKKFKEDPFNLLYKIAINLVPILLNSQKKLGKVSYSVPKLSKGNRRFVVMLN